MPITGAGAVVCSTDLHPLWFPAGRKPTRAVPKCVRRCESPQQKEMCSSDPLQEATRHPASRSVLADHRQQVLLSHNLVIELRSHDTQGTSGQGQSKAVVQGSLLFCLREDLSNGKSLLQSFPSGLAGMRSGQHSDVPGTSSCFRSFPFTGVTLP